MKVDQPKRLWRAMLSGLILAVFVAASTKAADEPLPPAVIYSKDNAPVAPKLDDLPLKESVSQYGITWTFAQPTHVGQFVNGDFYVVGPVTIATIDPKPLIGKEVPEDQLDAKYEAKVKAADRVRNGSMLNPPPNAEIAYDSGIKASFNSKLAVVAPLAMKAGDELVSSISLKRGEKAAFAYHSTGGRDETINCPTRVAAVLTCVAEPLPADAFRPGYSDRERRIYFAHNLNRDLLPLLPRVKGAPDPVSFAKVFQKPWLNTGAYGWDQPMENMPHYGQWVCQASSDASLLLCLDYKPQEKERLLQNFVQVGIDYWGAVRAGYSGWPANGGNESGRKFPIVFAGTLLGDEKMACVGREYPKVSFGEDEQTAYGEGWTGAKVVFTGDTGIEAGTGSVRINPGGQTWGPYEHLDPSKWNKDQHYSESARRSVTSCCWVGEALALHILKLEKTWNHDAFFDYVDRWMTEDDQPFRLEVFKFFPDDKPLGDDLKVWCQEGYTGEPWIAEMWTQYRAKSAAPIDGWKQKHDESYYNHAVEEGSKAGARVKQP